PSTVCDGSPDLWLGLAGGYRALWTPTCTDCCCGGMGASGLSLRPLTCGATSARGSAHTGHRHGTAADCKRDQHPGGWRLACLRALVAGRVGLCVVGCRELCITALQRALAPLDYRPGCLAVVRAAAGVRCPRSMGPAVAP